MNKVKIKWDTFIGPDGLPKYPQILVSENSDWNLFELVASLLEKGLSGEWVEKADGFDQRYWDLKVGSEVITLHLEHYLGITVFTENSKNKSPLLEQSYEILSAHGMA